MDLFLQKHNQMYCEEVDLADIACKYQTPVYVYSKNTLIQHCKHFLDVFKDFPTLCCYALKANSNTNIIKIIGDQGFGADIVSLGEYYKAKKAGINSDKIVFSGIGKTQEELQIVIKDEIFCINVESYEELNLIIKIAANLQKKVNICLRLNPNIDIPTHVKIKTGLYSSKFGMDEDTIYKILYEHLTNNYLNILGLSCHIGSQILSLEPLDKILTKILYIYDKVLKEFKYNFSVVNLGGGLGVKYGTEQPPSLEEYSSLIKSKLKNTSIQKLILEPGRVIVGNIGVLLSKVLYVKKIKNNYFVVIDAGMNDFMRPSLYDAYHEIKFIKSNNNENQDIIVADIVGPVCESSDVFLRSVTIPKPQAGDLVVIKGVGAYGFSMASQYNSRPRPAEILVDKNKVIVIRKKECVEDLFLHEIYIQD